MRRTGKYNEVTDLYPIDQIGYLDLAEAVENGYIPASLDATDDVTYNGIEDPASIMNYADDVFALYRQSDYINSFSKSKTGEPTPSAGEITE